MLYYVVMNNFDWNGNDEHDLFDDYMNMEAMNDSSYSSSSKSNHKKNIDVGSAPDSLQVILALCILGFGLVLPFVADLGVLGFCLSWGISSILTILILSV